MIDEINDTGIVLDNGQVFSFKFLASLLKEMGEPSFAKLTKLDSIHQSIVVASLQTVAVIFEKLDKLSKVNRLGLKEYVIYKDLSDQYNSMPKMVELGRVWADSSYNAMFVFSKGSANVHPSWHVVTTEEYEKM